MPVKIQYNTIQYSNRRGDLWACLKQLRESQPHENGTVPLDVGHSSLGPLHIWAFDPIIPHFPSSVYAYDMYMYMEPGMDELKTGRLKTAIIFEAAPRHRAATDRGTLGIRARPRVSGHPYHPGGGCLAGLCERASVVVS